MATAVIIMQSANIKDNNINLMIVTDPKIQIEPIVFVNLPSIKRLLKQARHKKQKIGSQYIN